MYLRWFKFNLSYPLTLIGSVLFLFLGIQASSALWTYTRLSARVEGVVDHWKAVKKSSSSYPLRASYHFEFQGKSYQSKGLLKPPYHLNRLSAEKAIKNLTHQKWTIWFNPKNPRLSALQKTFPVKKIVYALIALAITGYFGFLETSSRIRNPIQ